MRSALEWAQVRALAADGISQREIARRLGISRNTVRRLVEADEPPRYRRASVGSMRDPITWNARFLALRGHYAFHATACTPATPRETGSVEGGVRHLKSGFWPARRFGSLVELDEQYGHWRDRVCNRRTHATGRFAVGERLAHGRELLRSLPRPRSTSPGRGRSASRSTAT